MMCTGDAFPESDRLIMTQIGDLLASISGGEPPPKRKAAADDDGLPRATPNKVPRTSVSTTTPSGSSRAQQPSRPLDRPNAVPRPPNGTGNGISPGGSRFMGTASTSLKPMNGTHRVTKPTAPPRFTGTARPQQATRPANGADDGPAAAPKAPPKKGSFAEILARGKAAQATMGQVGKLQHKKTEKGAPVKKENGIVGKGTQRPDPRGKAAGASRTDPRAAANEQARKPAAAAASGYAGTAKPNAIRPGQANGQSSLARKPGSRPSDKDKDRKAAAEPERPKKAATATTGYTGTSRPRPGASSSKNPGKHPQQRGGALLNRQPIRRPASAARGSHSRYDDDYDEELDDFIEYDDEEEDEGGHGRRYTYDSGSDSDMEAGMDELDIEERMAERIARREDVEQEKLEKSLKAQKEERKRKALEELRAKRR